MNPIFVTVNSQGKSQTLSATRGQNLRKLLLENGLSPYGKFSKTINCGGRGICATCGVYFQRGEPKPTHWHDKIGNRFGYPRLSCQITINADMEIDLVSDKKMWGKRKK